PSTSPSASSTLSLHDALPILSIRLAEQRAVLAQAAALIKPRGRFVYITCSVLPEENGDQVGAFLAGNPGFTLVPYREQWASATGDRKSTRLNSSHRTISYAVF